MPDADAILKLVQRLASADDELSLGAVAELAGWSPFHLHRAFRATVGETPKQFQRRLRLQRALVMLATEDAPLRQVAARAGFGSHEGFTRTFRAVFGCTPTAFRTRTAGRWTPEHAHRMEAAGRCVGLVGRHGLARRTPMPLDVRIETREARPMLFMRRRVAPSELSAALAECLPKVFVACQSQGLAMAGPPFARYPEVGRGMLTVECGIPLVTAASSTGDILAGQLVGGTVAVGVHEGVYETMHETHAAIERWIEAQGRRPGGAPWETYITDPADHPDPADWRTEICWPIGD